MYLVLTQILSMALGAHVREILCARLSDPYLSNLINADESSRP